MTVSTPANPSRALEVSTRNRDSGVVIRTSGGREANARRSRAGVSPVRTPTVTGDNDSPDASASSAIPAKGRRRLRSTSTAKAFSGDTYTTRHR